MFAIQSYRVQKELDTIVRDNCLLFNVTKLQQDLHLSYTPAHSTSRHNIRGNTSTKAFYTQKGVLHTM